MPMEWLRQVGGENSLSTLLVLKALKTSLEDTPVRELLWQADGQKTALLKAHPCQDPKL